MRRKTKWMALFMAAAMMMTGCGGGSASTASTDSTGTAASSENTDFDGKKVVTMARDLDSNNLDPVMTADNCDIWILNMIVEGLVGTSDDGKEIIPAVADTWTVSDDGLEYVFHIRDGIKFSNGEDVTVEDCIYSLTRAKDTDGPWIGMI